MEKEKFNFTKSVHVKRYQYEKHNLKKFTYLQYIKTHPNKSCRVIAEKTYNKFSSEVTFEKHFRNTAMCLNRYTKYTRKIVNREKKNGVFVYSLSEYGRERLKQLIVAKAFFNTYRLQYYSVQLLLKDRFGQFAVNPEVIQYVPNFCDADPVFLWHFVEDYHRCR